MIDLVGNTPLVRLNRVTDGIAAHGAGQGRVLQPGRLGEGPDRPARWSRPPRSPARCSRAAPSSSRPRGNTGVGLALVAQQQRLPLRLRLPRQGERRTRSTCCGRTAPRSRSARPPSTRSTRDSYYSVSDRLAREIAGRLEAGPVLQPGEPARPTTRRPARRSGTQTDGRVTHFVAGVGTGGTISGTGRYLKEVSDGRGAGDRRRPGGLGLLRRHRPAVPRRGRRRGLLADDLRPDGARRDHRGVATATRSHMTRRLAREEGLLVGGSCGMAVVAALRVAERLRAATTSSSCCCPTAAAATCRRSSTTTGWPTTASSTRPTASTTVGDVLRRKGARRCRRSCTSTRTRRSARRSTSCASTASRRCRSSRPSRR